MKKILAVIAITLSVVGCTQLKEALTPRPNPLTAADLYKVELVFDGSVKTFNALKGLCARRALPPVCRTYVNKGIGIIDKANAADKTAQKFVAENPTVDATTVIGAFTGLANDFESNLSNLSATKAP